MQENPITIEEKIFACLHETHQGVVPTGIWGSTFDGINPFTDSSHLLREILQDYYCNLVSQSEVNLIKPR